MHRETECTLYAITRNSVPQCLLDAPQPIDSIVTTVL